MRRTDPEPEFEGATTVVVAAEPRRTTTFVVMALAVLAALSARVFALRSQILGGDELHVLDVLAATPLARIPGTVGEYDFSIPLALLYGALSRFIPLEEMTLRAPMLIAGCLLPVAGWYAFRPLVSGWVALGLGWLLALHPFVVFYGRFVRPYGIVLLLLLIALGALVRVVERPAEPAARRIGLAALLGALALWLNVPALFACCGLGLAALLAACCGRERARTLRRVLAFGALFLASTFLLYLPALTGLREHVLAGKTGQGEIDSETLQRTARVLGGSASIAVAGAMLVLAAYGGVAVLRRSRSLALWLLVPPLAIFGAVAATRPQLLEFDLVLARYAFNALPFVGVLALLGCEALTEFVPVQRRLRARVALLGLAVAVACGCWIASLASIYGVERAYAHHGHYQTYGHCDERHCPRASSVYAALANAPRVLEWPPPKGFDQNFVHLAQEVHRRPLGLLIVDERPFRADFLALRNCVSIEDVERGSLPPGTGIVLHRNPQFEAVSLRANREPRQVTTRNPQGFARLVERLTRALGPPVAEDPFAVAFVVAN